ncbi:F-box/FBD/LRR-repeat protein At1g13570-like [Rosa rugosa]|uniref:F-box/FBD/LRR-repeat protein At1g13570-like n=1 Tax=Rosa rugosa TaxID=74645 RepID=UPI002B401125|nr:F-box/FBD/LRR-repeat protein At1g13570-like [Rosa rugosa]XP_062022449.1 F-box/FBD/LRR-repeat protein At1g13570-like [Rosa rugosa]
MEVDLDRISNLPNEVIDKILSSLPLKDRARTSILSSKWRYKFAMLPRLVFDHQYTCKVVDHVLLSHIGPISKFQLTQGSKDIKDIDRWILHLSRHPINELILKFSVRPRYKMPSCMFSCQDLSHLNLNNCLLKPPSAFKGFRSLQRLIIKRVTLAQDVLDNMIVCSPLLERLTLENCDGFRQLKIDAPNLQFLLCIGAFDDFSIVNTLNLAVVRIRFTNLPVRRSSGNLLNFFANLPQVQSLHVNWFCLNYLAASPLLEKLPKPCLHLKVLEIYMSFDGVEHVSTALCLLRSSPALETLNINAIKCQDQADVGAVNSWLDNNWSCSVTQLRHVKIQRISGVEAELDFIRFLLISSPVLETMTVVPDAADENPHLVVLQNSLDIVKKLLRFRRASPNLEIIY